MLLHPTPRACLGAAFTGGCEDADWRRTDVWHARGVAPARAAPALPPRHGSLWDYRHQPAGDRTPDSFGIRLVDRGSPDESMVPPVAAGPVVRCRLNLSIAQIAGLMLCGEEQGNRRSKPIIAMQAPFTPACRHLAPPVAAPGILPTMKLTASMWSAFYGAAVFRRHTSETEARDFFPSGR